MATSGVTSVTYSAGDIIKSSLMKVGLIQFDSPTIPRQVESSSLRDLNMLVLALQSDGLHLWKETRLKLTPVTRRSRYRFGTAATEFTHVDIESKTIAAASSGDTTINVDTVGNFSDGDSLEIYLDDGTIHSTTVNGTPSSISGGYTVTLTDALDGALQTGGQVLRTVAYTGTPLRVLSAYRRIRSSDGSSFTDIELDVVTDGDFQEGPTPRVQGTTQCVHFERNRSSATLELYPEPVDDSTVFIMLDVQEPQEIFSSLSDAPDMTPEWYMALVYSLAKIFMDNNPALPLPDSHRLNIIRGEEKWVKMAGDFNKTPEHHDFSVDDSDYEVW